ncbi:MAG: hypothetical protein ACE14M_02140 [Terriglobales bacterium]
MKVISGCLLVLTLVFAKSGANANARNQAASATEAMYTAAADSAARKFQHIQQNASRENPDQTPTVFSEREINAYLASGRVKLPKGVRKVRLTGTPGVIIADARVDFDEITQSRRAANPLLALFTGVHDVHAESHAKGSGGRGHVRIDSVAFDGITVPRVALEYFVDRYIKPKHPNLGMDSTFQLPARVDLAIVGLHKLTVTQK